MTKGLVSIITPCYNGAKYISETIDSVLAQTYKDWEMIIIDDGSKDKSAEIVRAYMEKDSRIKFLQQANAGSAAARNNGIRSAEGQYIALLDADDLWEPEFLAEQTAFMTEKNAVCVYCSYRCINENSEEILNPVICREEISTKDMMVTNYIGCLSGLYDCSKHGKVYLKEELKSMRDDYAYWLDIVKLEDKAYGNQKLLARYRVLANSTTGNKKKLIKKQWRFYRDYLKLGVVKSFVNLVRWGLMGLKKYKGI
jgi:glycosyltransferase involved in cell wall biosynthesis